MREGHRMSRYMLCAFLSAAALQASIEGIVVNRSTGKPQPGIHIILVKPGQQGMQTIGTTVSDAAGRFVFEKDQPGGSPQLLQALYDGVTYNKLMTPNIPTSGVELDVYEATKSPAVAHVAQHMMLIEPSASSIAVSENVIVENESTATYNNPSVGSMRFFLPPAANGQVRVQVQGPQGMPLPRAAERTDSEGVFKVDYPIKPGETQFEVDYALPAGSPFTFRGEVVGVKGMPGGPLRLIAPAGVTLTGKDLQAVGTEPKTQASIYTVMASGPFSADITGVGTLRPPEATEVDQSDSPQVTEERPQIYRHMGWLLGLALTILAVGLVFLYTNSPVRAPYGKSPANK
jgi:hypothetical protein